MKKSAKQLLALTLAVAMAAMTGCGGGSTASTTAAPAAEATEAPAEEETQAEEAGTEESEAAEETEAAGAAGTSISQDNDLTVAIRLDFTTMDPLDTSDTLSGGIQRLMMDGFFGFDDDMKLIPMLATDYEANDEATEYTFHLRQGIQFSDGTPWDAEAAKANFDRWDDKSLGLKRTSMLCDIIDHTDIVDDYTIKVTLTESFAALIASLAHPACLCVSPKIIEQGSAVAAETPVGTGQYTFVEWTPGEKAVIALNKDWWGYDPEICGGTALVDPDAGFKTLTFRPITEDATRVAMIQAGDAQMIQPVPTESMELLRGDTSLNVEEDSGIVVQYLMMNNQKAPFNDVRVRQAINYALSKDAYINIVKNGLAEPATSMLGSAVAHYKGNDPAPYDPEKAKELLAEAGYPDGFTAVLTTTNSTSDVKQAEFYQQQLAQVGIDIQIESLEAAVMNEKIQDTDAPGPEAAVEMYTTKWSPSTGDADWGLRPMLAIDSEPPKNYNICYYENEKVDQLLMDALATPDESKRGELYGEVQDIVWEELPMIFMAVDKNTWATTKNIADAKIFPDGCMNLRNAKMYE